MVICALWYCDEVFLKASPNDHLQNALLLCGMSGAGEKEKERAKGKRNVKQEEDEDYRELPQKKHKLYGRVCPSMGDRASPFKAVEKTPLHWRLDWLWRP